MSWSLAATLRVTGGELLQWGPGPFRAISTDSRRIRPGEMFLALSGPNHDAHDFLLDAVARGATGAIVSKDASAASPEIAWIRVRDGLEALGDLAAAKRRAIAAQVVGVTGSNGKTTTKDMIAAVLGAGGATVAKTRANENNLVGLPHTILGLAGDEQFLVLEMGMNHPGEIWRLAEIAAPNVGVVTNVGPAHLEGVGTIEDVAAAKEELPLALSPEATFVANGDDPRVLSMAERFPGKTVVVGAGRDVRALRAEPSEAGQRVTLAVGDREATVELRCRGAHNVANALLAVAVGRAFGLDLETITAGLAAFETPPMRLEAIALPSGARLLNDAYNANPASMRAAIASLAVEPALRRIAVLGEMWELGPDSERYHREVAAETVKTSIDRLVAVGRYAADMAAAAAALPRVDAVASPAEAARLLAGALRAGDVVLVKGSRSARMEEIVTFLREQG